MALTTERLNAVSYTHLDVYKRQTLNSTSEGTKGDQSALLSEDKPNREKEKIMPIEIKIKGVKKQIIKKTKERGIIRLNKRKNTREEVDMIKS